MTTPDDTKAAPQRPPIALWKKLLLVLSVVVMVGALAMQGYAMLNNDDDATAAPARAPNGSLAPAGFAPGDVGAETGADEPDPDTLDAWSPAIFRLGFSFFIGFCIGYAVRTFLKLSMLAIGLLALALFGLQYAGIVDVDWQAASGHYDSIAEWIRAQTSSFTAFIQGHLPSAGLAAFGLIAGFRRG